MSAAAPIVRAFRERVWLARCVHEEGTFVIDSESEAQRYIGRIGWEVHEYRIVRGPARDALIRVDQAAGEAEPIP